MNEPIDGTAQAAADIIHRMALSDLTLGCAESLTGGRLVAALTSVPGSSAVVRGAIVAYTSAVKEGLLGVDARVLADLGPVCEQVAVQMAAGARERLGADYGVATTGEAGPESASGRPVGTVHVAVSGPEGTSGAHVELTGDRAEIQHQAVTAALELLLATVPVPGGTR